MNVLLFGATGMIGQGVLRECLLDPGVARVIAVVRSPIGQTHGKLREVISADATDLTVIGPELSGVNACFFCLGVTSAGLSEQEYSTITFDLTVKVAQGLLRRNPGMTFIYISGQGTDSSERGGVMWARVKGRTENALLALPFKATYMFRPGLIQPLHGIRSKTGWYNAFYSVTAPIYPLLRRVAGRFMTNTEQLGKAMINVARKGSTKRILETADINSA